MSALTINDSIKYLIVRICTFSALIDVIGCRFGMICRNYAPIWKAWEYPLQNVLHLSLGERIPYLISEGHLKIKM